MRITQGIEPRRSISVWSLMAPLCCRKEAHGKSERHRSIVVESKPQFHLLQISYSQPLPPPFRNQTGLIANLSQDMDAVSCVQLLPYNYSRPILQASAPSPPGPD